MAAVTILIALFRIRFEQSRAPKKCNERRGGALLADAGRSGAVHVLGDLVGTLAKGMQCSSSRDKQQASKQCQDRCRDRGTSASIGSVSVVASANIARRKLLPTVLPTMLQNHYHYRYL